MMDGLFSSMDDETKKAYMEHGRTLMQARRAEILSYSTEEFEQLRNRGYTFFRRYCEEGQWRSPQLRHASITATASNVFSAPDKQSMDMGGSGLPQSSAVAPKAHLHAVELESCSVTAARSPLTRPAPVTFGGLCELPLCTASESFVCCGDGDSGGELRDDGYSASIGETNASNRQTQRLSNELQHKEATIQRLNKELKELGEINSRHLEREAELHGMQQALEEQKRKLQLDLLSATEGNHEYKTQVKDLHDLLAEKEKELHTIREHYSKAKQELDTIKSEYCQLKEEKDECESKILPLQTANDRLTAEVQATKEKLRVASDHVRELEQELESLRKLNDESNKVLNTPTRELDTQTENNRNMHQEMERTMNNEKIMNHQIKDLQQHILIHGAEHKTVDARDNTVSSFNPFLAFDPPDNGMGTAMDGDDHDIFSARPYEQVQNNAEFVLIRRVAELKHYITILQDQLTNERMKNTPDTHRLTQQPLKPHHQTTNYFQDNNIPRLSAEIDNDTTNNGMQPLSSTPKTPQRLTNHQHNSTYGDKNLLKQRLEECRAEQEARLLEDAAVQHGSGGDVDALMERLNALQASNDELRKEISEMEERQREELAAVTQEAADRIAEHDELLKQRLEECRAEREACLPEGAAVQHGSGGDVDALMERLNALQASNDELRKEISEMEERQREELAAVTQEAADRIAEHDEVLKQRLEECRAEQEARLLEDAAVQHGSGGDVDALMERLNALQASNDELRKEIGEMEERQREELAAVTQEAADRIAEHDELLKQRLEECRAEQEARLLEDAAVQHGSGGDVDALMERLNALQASNDELRKEIGEMEERQREELAAVTQEAADRIAEHDELLKQRLEECRAEQEARLLEDAAVQHGSGGDVDALMERLNALQASNDELRKEISEMEERQREELAAVTQEAADRIAEHDELLKQRLEECRAEQEARLLEDAAVQHGSGGDVDALMERLNALQASNDELRKEIGEMEERQREELAAVTQEAADRIAEHDELLKQRLEECRAEQEARLLEDAAVQHGSGGDVDALMERLNALQASNDELRKEIGEMEERQREELAAVTQEAADRIAEHDELLKQRLEECRAEQEARLLEDAAVQHGSGGDVDALMERLNALQASNDELRKEIGEMEERQHENFTVLSFGSCFCCDRCGVAFSCDNGEGSSLCAGCVVGSASVVGGGDCGGLNVCCGRVGVDDTDVRSSAVVKCKRSPSPALLIDNEAYALTSCIGDGFIEEVESGGGCSDVLKCGKGEEGESGTCVRDCLYGGVDGCRSADSVKEQCEKLTDDLQAEVGDGDLPLITDGVEGFCGCKIQQQGLRGCSSLSMVEDVQCHRYGFGEQQETVGSVMFSDIKLGANWVEGLFMGKVMTIPYVVQKFCSGILEAHECLCQYHVGFQRKLLARCDILDRAVNEAILEGERQCEKFISAVENVESERQRLVYQVTEFQQEVVKIRAASGKQMSEFNCAKEDHEKETRELCEKLNSIECEMEAVKVEHAKSLQEVELLKVENTNVLHLLSEAKKTAADAEEQRREVHRLQQALSERGRSSRELLEAAEGWLAETLEESDQSRQQKEQLEKQAMSAHANLERALCRLDHLQLERDSMETQLLDAMEEVQTLVQRNRTTEEASRRHVDTLSETLKELQEANTQLSELSKEQQTRLESLESQLHISEAEVERLRSRTVQQEDDARRLHVRLNEMESLKALQVEESAAALRAAELRVAALEHRKTVLQEELELQRQKNCELQDCCDELEGRLRHTTDASHSTEQGHRRRIQLLTEQVEALQLELRGLQEAHEGLVADRGTLVRERVGAVNEAERASFNLEKCTRQNKQLQHELRLQQESYESEIRAAQATLDGAREELSKWRHTLEEAESQQHAMRETIQTLQMEKATRDEEMKAMRFQLQEYQSMVAQGYCSSPEAGVKVLQSGSDGCGGRGSPVLPLTPSRAVEPHEMSRSPSTHVGYPESSKTRASRGKGLAVAQLRSVLEEKSRQLEEKETEVESLHRDMRAAIVQVVQEARSTQLGSRSPTAADQAELLLNTILHNLLLQLSRLSQGTRESSAESLRPGRRDLINAEDSVSPRS